MIAAFRLLCIVAASVAVLIPATHVDPDVSAIIQTQSRQIQKLKRGKAYLETTRHVDPENADNNSVRSVRLFKFRGDDAIVYGYGKDLKERGGDDTILLFCRDGLARINETDKGDWNTTDLVQPDGGDLEAWVKRGKLMLHLPFRCYGGGYGRLVTLETITQEYESVDLTQDDTNVRVTFTGKRSAGDPQNNVSHGTVTLAADRSVLLESEKVWQFGEGVGMTTRTSVEYLDGPRHYIVRTSFDREPTTSIVEEVEIKQLDQAPEAKEFDLASYTHQIQRPTRFWERGNFWFVFCGALSIGIGLFMRKKMLQ